MNSDLPLRVSVMVMVLGAGCQASTTPSALTAFAAAPPAAVHAAVEPTKPTAPSAGSDAASPSAEETSVMEFLEAYAEAVRTRDGKFLTLHTRFPLPVVVLEYSMDLHHVERTLHRPDELEPEIVGLSDDRFLAQLAKRPHPLRRGVSNLPGPPDSGLEYYTDYSEGEPAIDIHGARVTVTVTADVIGVMSHATELDFSNEGGVLRLTALKMQ